jgi:heme-degrading monooxygenase HmoA
MSVLMTLRLPVEPGSLEQAVAQHRDAFMSIADDARSRGCIHHDFYAGDGEVIVVDEWESAEAFQGFWDTQGGQIGEVMAAAGISGEPAPPQFHQKLSLGDEF